VCVCTHTIRVCIKPHCVFSLLFLTWPSHRHSLHGVEVLPQHLPEGAKENHEKLSR